MSVETFDPGALGGPLDPASVQAVCEIALGFEADELALADAEVARFAALAAHPGWAEQVGGLSDAQLEGLIKVFTLGEMQYPSWAAGEKSPVVVLVKALKARDAYPPELNRWIKAHTTNKFLPHGSLMDRL